MARITASTKKELIAALAPLPDDAFIEVVYAFSNEEWGYGSIGGPISYIRISKPEPEYEYNGQATIVIDDKYLNPSSEG